MAPVYDQNEALNTLWNEIMNVHWKFLDADESMEKIQLRKSLEDLIRQYLCNVPHNQKFFLPPTVQVLKNSIAKLEDFSAYKAAIGFEAISQYANNLFTKPWRKEYKVIKMYSGFYQHEIAANLIGAEVLFEQMGYRTMPNETLVLEGPICPDRVTNVSRDAITANVECQIMKEICRDLAEMSLSVDWSDIYSFRECNTMNVMQSVQQMALLIQEKHQKTQQARRKGWYRGEKRWLHYSSPRTWLKPRNHEADCFFCAVQVGHGKAITIYPDLPSSAAPKLRETGLENPIRKLPEAVLSSSTLESESVPSVAVSEYRIAEVRSPHYPNQKEIDDLVRDLSLTKANAELLISRLKEWELLDGDVKITTQRKRHEPYSSFFTYKDGLCFCHDVGGLFDEMGLKHEPKEWRLFIDSSSKSLKAVLLHNGNEHPSIPVAHSKLLKENYDSTKLLMDSLHYSKYCWEVIGDFKMIAFLMGLQESYGSMLAPAVSSCNSCNPYQFHPHMQQQQQQQQPQQSPAPQPPPLAVHSQQAPSMPFCGPQSLYNAVPCSMHNQPPSLAYGYHLHNSYQSYLPTSPSQPHAPHPSNQSSVIPQHPPPPLGVIPHSKSLDHYQDSAAAMYNLTACMQRHSIDQAFDYAGVSSASHYGGPMGMGPPTGVYDAVDSCNMPYNNHPYNVSGNRFPLPYNISANIGPCMNGMPGKPNGNEPFYQPSINGYQQMPPYYHHRSSSNGQIYGQQAPPHRHAADIYMNHSFDHVGSQTPTSILSKKKTAYDDYDVPSIRHGVESKNPADLIYIDTREEPTKERKKSDRSMKGTDLLIDYECDMLPESLAERNQLQQQQQQQQHPHRHPYLHHQTSRNSRQSDFDSYEDEQLQSGANVRATNVTKRISSKNQDGIGSYEQWNYVFQNLEKQGYTKDLGERGDFLVDVDGEEYPEGNTSRGSTLKRSSNDKLKAMKAKSADKVDGIRMSSSARQSQSNKHDRDNERNEMTARTAQKPISVQKVVKPSSNTQADNSQKAIHTGNPTSSSVNSGGTIGRRNSIPRKVTTSIKENGTLGNVLTSNNASGGGILVNHNNSSYTSSSTSGKKKTTSFDTAAATIINPEDDRRATNGRSEWNCEFCTFLNPDTRRICEMCSKSRDFNNGGTTTTTSNGTATCV